MEFGVARQTEPSRPRAVSLALALCMWVGCAFASDAGASAFERKPAAQSRQARNRKGAAALAHSALNRDLACQCNSARPNPTTPGCSQLSAVRGPARLKNSSHCRKPPRERGELRASRHPARPRSVLGGFAQPPQGRGWLYTVNLYPPCRSGMLVPVVCHRIRICIESGLRCGISSTEALPWVTLAVSREEAHYSRKSSQHRMSAALLS